VEDSVPGAGRKTIENALLLSFALSGGAALLSQSVWQRELSRLVGSTTPAAAVVYAGVMAGLGAGALLGNAILSRGAGLFTGINPLRFFALLEALTCAFAFAYAIIFNGGWLHQIPGLGDETARLALAFVLVAMPSLLMGGTWPAAVAAAERISIDATKSSSLLYAVNLIGALFGAAFGAFYFIPSFGLAATLGIAGGFNLVAGICAVALSLAAVKLISPRNEIEVAASSASDAVMPQFDCLLVFLSAAVTLALEVVFTRLFTLVLGSSVYSVAVVLVGILFGMATSAQFASALTMSRVKPSVKAFAANANAFTAVAASIAALLVFGEACLLNRLPMLILHFSEQAAGFNFQDLPTFRAYLFPRVMICLCMVILPIAFVSSIFPFVLQSSLRNVNAKSGRASWLYSASTLGAVFGSLAAGLFFVPTLSERYESGLMASLVVIAGTCLFIAALAASHQVTIATKKERASGVIFLSSAAIVGLLATLYPPQADTFLLSQGLGMISLDSKAAVDKLRESIEAERKNTSMIFYREGLNTTVAVQDFPKNNVVVLKNDGKVEAAIPRNLAVSAPTSDYPTQVLLGCLPYTLSAKNSLDALVIGCGSGVTYGALAEQKNIAALTVAEIEKAVFEASRFFLPQQKAAERADIRKLICDARSHLAFSGNRYDLIVSQPAEPWVNGAGDLYTQEFFALVHSRLKEGGLFCQWLQLYAIDEENLLVLLNTIHSAFPSTYVFHPHGAGEVLIVSFKTENANQASAKLDAAKLLDVIAEPAVKAKLKYCHLVSAADLLSMLVLSPQSLDELLWKKLGTNRILFNTDNNLRSEYSLPYQLLNKDDRIEKNMEVLRTVRTSLADCLKNVSDDVKTKAEFLDRVAISMAGYSQKHPGEGLDEAALAAAYEAWTMSESPATAAVCDLVAHMTGRFSTAKDEPRALSKEGWRGSDLAKPPGSDGTKPLVKPSVLSR
jgi:spermidine synthase